MLTDDAVAAIIGRWGNWYCEYSRVEAWMKQHGDMELLLVTIAELREELDARKEYLTAYRDAATTDTINSRRRTARWKRIVVRLREELARKEKS